MHGEGRNCKASLEPGLQTPAQGFAAPRLRGLSAPRVLSIEVCSRKDRWTKEELCVAVAWRLEMSQSKASGPKLSMTYRG
jgi:hypothetical protein